MLSGKDCALRAKPRVALGLQGGGAYGAYGWGIIDRLLEEHVEIVAVSGASAGALNGAALVTGLATGGDAAAQAALARLWRAVADRSPLRGLDLLGASGPLFEPFLNRSLAAVTSPPMCPRSCRPCGACSRCGPWRARAWISTFWRAKTICRCTFRPPTS
ncbi:patatin-like phospholipase family protein [Methylobacterium sp. E-046]|uniref:patatin-like phospholipase family protein n=1 Tax=Methylobacterium sp. E-046 TaxID=2836576 RepID=UPI00391C3664